MTTTDTKVNQLVINRLTKTQFDGASPSSTEIYAVDPEFVGGKLLKTNSDGDIVETNETIPTDTNDLTNGAGFITGITSGDVTTALGYTPYDASNPNGYTSNVGTVTSVNNTSPDGNGNVSISIPSEVTETTVSNWGFTKNTGTVTSVNSTSPDGNGNVSLTIPTVNNSTITITQGGVTKGSFTLNQSTGDTIALDAGGGSSLPSQTGNAGKFLTTDGTDASWGRVKTNDLFDHKWTDYELSDQNWLRADTYSWQDGTVYSDAYNHLVDDIDGKTATSETVGSYTISYYLADDGHKITTDETNVANIYNESGVAWYYILDTANTRFKLPRTKYGFTGLRDAVGKYVAAGLPNITGYLGLADRNSNAKNRATGAFSWNSLQGSSGKAPSTDNDSGDAYFDASQSNAIYGASTTVQPPATQMYLYFYVGQYSQTATEQTAGLNASLFNGKMDLDMSNMNPSQTAKETIVGWGMPDYSAGVASGTSFTAPSDGWVYIYRSTPKDSALKADIDNVSVLNCMNRGYMVADMSALIPIAKGSIFSGVNGSSATFFPCKGV